MKHLIAFLGYNQSRIQHPVYRQFVQAPIARRNATLLFQSRPLEERELVHEVNELRRREGRPCELAFHICASLNDPAMGQQIVQTITMIHRLYDCASYVYCLLPDPNHCTDEQRNNAWKCLSAINNGVNDYPHLRLLSHCFLYHDASQQSLARFLYQVTREPEALDLLERYGYMGKLVSRRITGDMSYVPEFPRIFSTFNATGIQYPDDEIRYYIHQSYLKALLQLSRPAFNPISMEQCNEHVESLLTVLPLNEEKLMLSGSEFIMLPQTTKQRPWQPTDEYWQQCIDKAIKDLEDRPREEWLNQLRNNMEVYYRSRFREMGVDYFYQQQKHLTSNYCNVMLAQLKEGLRQIISTNPYPPETSLDIVRSLTNHLQQLALGFNMTIHESNAKLSEIDAKNKEIERTWDSMGFFDRMRGKDKVLFDDYKIYILDYYKFKTRIQGADFALKLLNEFIPQISALPDSDNRLGQLCQGALETTMHYLENNNPQEFIDANFDFQTILDAATAISVDQQALCQDYSKLQSILYPSSRQKSESAEFGIIEPLDSEGLLQQLRDTLSQQIDQYIHQRISDGTMSAILDVNVVDRLASIYAGKGGLSALVQQMKEETALSLKMKREGGHNEQYLLIAPSCVGLGSYITSTESSSIQMLHLLTGISLTDLDGFAGQRMFVEPSMF